MGKTKEMLIAMQEEMMMDWQHDMLTGLHEDLEVEEEMLVKLPTPSSNTSSEPVQTIDTEAFTDELFDMIQTGSQASLASQLRKSLDEKNLK